MRRDSRLLALVCTVLAVIAGGAALARMAEHLGGPPEMPAPGSTAKGPQAAEIQQRFDQGVVMLHARQYEHALTAFHRVLALAPDIPEAHVNMGFALVGMKRFGAARDFFQSATSLRPQQANAYYGLAESLEALNDLPGAIGAMKTYVHLSAANDRYLPKAQAALWAWQSALAGEARKTGKSQ